MHMFSARFFGEKLKKLLPMKSWGKPSRCTCSVHDSASSGSRSATSLQSVEEIQRIPLGSSVVHLPVIVTVLV